MSVSSYSSECSSSSSSSSGSSSSSSSSSGGSLGKFSSSSKASFSSCSTIVEAQPTVRPFGCPVFNYFWLEKRSKTFPDKKYYWNFKSHAVVWERPVPKEVPIPIYTNAQTFFQRNISDNEDFVVSEPEDNIRRTKRLAVKLRNRRLAVEEEDDAIQVLSVKKTIKSKKMLDTFWKLYRCPGESIKDVKKRLLISMESTFKIKTELDSTCNEYNTEDIMETSGLVIKKEVPFNNDEHSFNEDPFNEHSFNLNDSVSIIKKDEDSDSDPENVSRLIKQEYLMHYEGTDAEEEEYDVKRNIVEVDKQMEKDSEDEEDEDSEEDEEESDNFSDVDPDNYKNNMNFQNSNEILENENDNFEYEYEAPYLQEDLLSVEINEDNNGKIFLPVDDDIVIESIKWNFDQSETVNNTVLTCSAITTLYGAPKMKQITSKHLVSSNRKKRKVKTQKKKVPKLIIQKVPSFDVKSEQESSGNEKPIICDRYGVRTFNYNHPPKVKLPNWQVYTKLSDSSGNESSDDVDYKSNRVSTSRKVQNISKQVLPSSQRKDEGALELKNWFPKQRGRKRKNKSPGSDSSWCESDLSDCTSLDEFDRKLIRMKKEKRSSSYEREALLAGSHRKLMKVKKEKSSSSEKEASLDEFDRKTIRVKKEKRSSSSEKEASLDEFDRKMIRVKKEKRSSSSEKETSLDEFDKKLIRVKKEKRDSSSERDVQLLEFDRKLVVSIKKKKRSFSSESGAEYSVIEHNVIKTSIGKKIQEHPLAQQTVESKKPGSSTPSAQLSMDLSRVKVEVPSDLEEQSCANKVEENSASDADHSDIDSSSGLSHTCSRSSCSCCSSSSASSSDSDNEDDAGNKNIVKEHIDN